MPTYPQDADRPTISVTVSDFRYFVPPASTDGDLVTCEVLPGIYVRESLGVLEQWEADLGRAINRLREQATEARR
jgi:hypothetical protein